MDCECEWNGPVTRISDVCSVLVVPGLHRGPNPMDSPPNVARKGSALMPADKENSMFFIWFHTGLGLTGWTRRTDPISAQECSEVRRIWRECFRRATACERVAGGLS